MKDINIPTVSLLNVNIHRVALSEKIKLKKPMFWNIDNLLMENGDNLLFEDGGAIVLQIQNN